MHYSDSTILRLQSYNSRPLCDLLHGKTILSSEGFVGKSQPLVGQDVEKNCSCYYGGSE